MTGRTFALILACGALAALSIPGTVMAAGGTIVRLQGTASVERHGKKIPVSESFPLFTGDVLDVAANSSAQIHFEDDSIFVVPGTAKFRVDEFSMPRSGTKGKAIYTLVDGAVRTITGSVKGSKGDYELRTEEGSVTVDGSAYSALRCNGRCARKHPAGLYVKGEAGTIILASAGAQLKLKPGQIGFIPGGGGTPIVVRVSPFGDPELAEAFGATVEFGVEIHPPRIEQEPVASPS